MRWRKIECSLRVEIKSEGVCINGVLYYLGYMWEEMSEVTSNYVIVCFDVRSEKFKFIYPESLQELINYKGKLGVIYNEDFTDDAIELRVWVLEDVEKQEWSKYAYTLRDDRFFLRDVFIVGVNSTGEIVLSMAKYTSNQPFYVYYFNPETNTLQRVEIQGFGEYHESSDKPRSVYVFADHVDDLNVHDSKLLKSSISVPYVYREESEEDDKDYDEYGSPCFSGKRKKKKKMNMNLKKGMRIIMKMMKMKRKKR